MERRGGGWGGEGGVLAENGDWCENHPCKQRPWRQSRHDNAAGHMPASWLGGDGDGSMGMATHQGENTKGVGEAAHDLGAHEREKL